MTESPLTPANGEALNGRKDTLGKHRRDVLHDRLFAIYKGRSSTKKTSGVMREEALGVAKEYLEGMPYIADGPERDEVLLRMGMAIAIMFSAVGNTHFTNLFYTYWHWT